MKIPILPDNVGKKSVNNSGQGHQQRGLVLKNKVLKIAVKAVAGTSVLTLKSEVICWSSLGVVNQQKK